MTEREKWRRYVVSVGSKEGKLPAAVEFYDDRIAAGEHPPFAARAALQDCEITEIVEEH